MKSGGSRKLPARSLDSQDSQPTARLTNLSFSIRRTAAAVPRLLLFAVAYAFSYPYTGGFGESVRFPFRAYAINVLFLVSACIGASPT